MRRLKDQELAPLPTYDPSRDSLAVACPRCHQGPRLRCWSGFEPSELHRERVTAGVEAYAARRAALIVEPHRERVTAGVEAYAARRAALVVKRDAAASAASRAEAAQVEAAGQRSIFDWLSTTKGVR